MHAAFADYPDDEVFAIFCHEAGHAVAALACGRPINEMYIHPDTGFTGHGVEGSVYPDEVRLFVVYAGPWAQARALAGEADSLAFEELVKKLLWEFNFCDWVEFQLASRREIREGDCHAFLMDSFHGADPPYDSAFDPKWNVDLEGLLHHIKNLATAMYENQALIEIDLGERKRASLQRIGSLRWARPGFQPIDDSGPSGCCQHLVRFFASKSERQT